METKSIQDMRCELEQWVNLPDATPSDMIRGLYQCYKMATDTRLPQHVRSTMEFLFTTFESSNGDWDTQFQELRAQVNRNAEFDGDLVGRFDDNDYAEAG